MLMHALHCRIKSCETKQVQEIQLASTKCNIPKIQLQPNWAYLAQKNEDVFNQVWKSGKMRYGSTPLMCINWYQCSKSINVLVY